MSKRIIGNVVGLPSPRSDFKQTDEMKADFIKNKPIEKREDGFYLVDKEHGVESHLASPEGYIYADEAGYVASASEADYAHYAGADAEGRTLKGVFIEDNGDEENVDIYLEDGCTFSYGIINNSLMISHYNAEDMDVDFLSGLHFTTPSVMPENYSQCDSIYFKGDSTDEGAFIPEKNTRYSIVFFFDGNQVVGCVLGVPAPSVKEAE